MNPPDTYVHDDTTLSSELMLPSMFDKNGNFMEEYYNGYSMKFDNFSKFFYVQWSPLYCPRKLRVSVINSKSRRENKVKWIQLTLTTACFQTYPNCVYKVQLANPDLSVTLNCRSVFSQSEVGQLYSRVVKYIVAEFEVITFIYRDKPKTYYHGKNVMIAALKDNNGHSYNPTNRAVKGIHFNARPSPGYSIYGDRRFKVPCAQFLDPKNYNLYFSDFYCYHVGHYALVVPCKKGSANDRYFAATLKELDFGDNHILRVKESEQCPSGLSFFVNKNLHVEVFVPEDIKISNAQLNELEHVSWSGERKNVEAHNKYCTICNLEPLPLPPFQRQPQRIRRTSTSA